MTDDQSRDYRNVLTFIHLSDIHFTDRDHGSQFDVEQHIRRGLLEDLATNPAGASDYDALLVTGDIAFAGKPEDYVRAKQFLEDVFEQTSVSPVSTFMVPGNHDVDRAFVLPKFPLWDSHERLRQTQNPVEWRDILDTQLHKDPLQTLLAPLGHYNAFAQGFGCMTTATQLAWQHVLDSLLEDGTAVRLSGLNSALISDAADAPSKLLVSEFQTAHLCRDQDSINVVLCHHPPDWLLDKMHIREVLNGFAVLGLFGHEHTTHVVAQRHLVEVFAGAVQPSQRDPGNWLPTYHIIQLSVSQASGTRELVIRIHTREFSTAKQYKFHPRMTASGELVDEHRITLPAMKGRVMPNRKQQSSSGDVSAGTSENANESSEATHATTSRERALRELLVYFFRLGTPLRFAVAVQADLIRDGDDVLDPREMWAEVFRRAVNENRLESFWSAVAKRTPALSAMPNPFSSKDNASPHS